MKIRECIIRLRIILRIIKLERNDLDNEFENISLNELVDNTIYR